MISCPNCGENNPDRLPWDNPNCEVADSQLMNEWVTCAGCGCHYQPGHVFLKDEKNLKIY